MGRLRVVTTGVLAAVGLALGTSAARADAPPPVLSPGCEGLIVAATNHESGVFGPSGNPNASTGPGFFFGPNTAEEIQAVRELVCP